MFNALTWLTEPLAFEFMRNAFIIGILLGILCAVVGSYLIVQQMSMMGGVISHAVVPGLSIAFFLGVDLAVGAFVAGVLSALVVAGIQARSRIKVDAAMSLTLTSFLGFGVMLITLLGTNRVDLTNILFGDILGVEPSDVWQTLGITLAILALVKLFYKELLFYTFDPLGAQASGLPIAALYLGLICAITLTIVASMQTVGVLLAIALLVGPAISAYLLVKELHQMMILGAILGCLASVGGMYGSYYLDIPSGSAIVMAVALIFVLTLFFSPSQGLLTESRRRRKSRNN